VWRELWVNGSYLAHEQALRTGAFLSAAAGEQNYPALLAAFEKMGAIEGGTSVRLATDFTMITNQHQYKDAHTDELMATFERGLRVSVMRSKHPVVTIETGTFARSSVDA
jgi:hypothetical protein